MWKVRVFSNWKKFNFFECSLHLRKAKNDATLVRTHQSQLVRLQQEANVALRIVRLAAQARHRPDVGDGLSGLEKTQV